MERTAVSVQEAQQKYGEMKSLEVNPGAKVGGGRALTWPARQGAEVRDVPAAAEGEDGGVPQNRGGGADEAGGVHRVREKTRFRQASVQGAH